MAAGKKPILLGPTKAQHRLLRAAAEKEGRELAPFVLRSALLAAEKIVAEEKKSAG